MRHPGSSSAAASAVGRANRKVGTKPEALVRAILHRNGYRFRKDYPIKLPYRRSVRADIVFTKRRLAVFIDGCFWHRCPLHGTRPRSNPEYWDFKLQRNVDRDDTDNDDLRAAGWTVLRIWEHVPPIEAASHIVASLIGAEPALLS
jgi:DNA mismatch endonuclease, patch repair protein